MSEKKPHKTFSASRSAENAFARALRMVGKISGHLVEAHVDGHKIRNEAEMKRALEKYSKTIEPWAKRQSAKMLAKVSSKSKSAFTKNAKKMGKLIENQVAESDVGDVAQALMNEQVALIKSLPIRAAERAQKLAFEAALDGSRADDVAKELLRSGKVSESQATLIARTEVARSNASINQARAQAVGSKVYRWRNSGDEAVRESHRRYHGKKLDGMVFSWSSPPTLDDGMTGHPGTFPSCRCYAEPVFDE